MKYNFAVAAWQRFAPEMYASDPLTYDDEITAQ